MSYYESQGSGQWPASAGPGNPPPPQQPSQASGWDHQTPPARSGASSVIPREDSVAFSYQIEEVDRAIDNLMKSGKMFNMGGRPGRASTSSSQGPSGASRPSSVSDFGGESRHTPTGNVQNFYQSQRHQPSRGSNDAESMVQAKRRMAAARERELRNYHQEQQYNRTVLADMTTPGVNGKTDRTLSPGGMSEEGRRDLIARQRSALYGEGPFAETGGCYVDETGATRSGLPGTQTAVRGSSPQYGRGPHPDAPGSDIQGQPPGSVQRSRAGSASSPHSNAPTNSQQQQSNMTATSSPDDSPARQGQGVPIGTKPGQPAPIVAPIGTRPAAQAAFNPALNTGPSPMGHGFGAPPATDSGASATTTTPSSNPPSASAENNVGLGGWGSKSGVWGNKSGLQASASVWG